MLRLEKFYRPLLLAFLTYSFSTEGFGITTIINKKTRPAALTIVSISQNDNDGNNFPSNDDSSDCTSSDRGNNSPLFLDRRQMIIQSAAALTVARSTDFPAFAATAKTTGGSYEVILPQSTLVADLSSAPVRNIIITGANSGVGLSGAKLLTAAGHSVTLACRTQAKADAAANQCSEYAAAGGRRPGGKAVGAECNLASLASIRKFAATQKEAKIDTLVLNAGLAHGQNDEKVYRTEDGFEETIGVNHLGHFYLANLLAPSLTTDGGRLVITASPVHDPKSGGGDVGEPASLGTLQGLAQQKNFEMVDGKSYNADKAYKDSKLCNILFMEEAARRYEGKFTVNAFSPGLIADPNGFFRYQNPQFASVFNKITKVTGVAETNEFGGSALSYLAVSPAMDGQTGGWYEAQNVDEQHTLWKLSEELLGVKS